MSRSVCCSGFLPALGLMFASAFGAAATALGISDTGFTLKGEPAFLLGISYYGALGGSQDFPQRDLDDVQHHGLSCCFHNGHQNDHPEGRSRQSFDLRQQRLFEQLDNAERNVLVMADACVPRTGQEQNDGFVSLFNGQDLAGWKASENPDSFVVRDGMIVAQGQPRSHLYYTGPVSNAAFKDFEFQADVRTEPESNGGIYFHTRYLENNWPQTGCEVQVNTLKTEKRKTGSLYAIQDVIESPVKDGDWFHVRIIVSGNRVVVKVDGKTVVNWTQPADFQPPKNPTWSDRRLASGTFALQAHDSKSVVYYKNIRVKILNEPAPAESKVNPPKEPIPGVEHRTFQSASMRHDVGFNIDLPPRYADSGQRFPVVYYLHGMTDCESTHPQLFGILDQAIRAGEVPPMILFRSMCGRTSFYADSPDGEVMGETVFIEELIPHVDRTVRTIASRGGRAVLG